MPEDPQRSGLLQDAEADYQVSSCLGESSRETERGGTPPTPDPRPPAQADAGRDLSNTTGFGKISRILVDTLSAGRAKLCVYVSQGETEAQRERAQWHRENAHGVSKACVWTRLCLVALRI